MHAVVFLVLVVTSSALGQEQAGSSSNSHAYAGGFYLKVSDNPWLVGVYRCGPTNKDEECFEQICGGSLISAKAVLSAAHCFWNEGNTIPLHEYRITAGNFYRDFYDTEMKQVFKVKNVLIHDRYQDSELKYARDIAIVWLDGQADITKPEVKPIPIDWNIDFRDEQLIGLNGAAVGWGFTEHNAPSKWRVSVFLPYIPFDKCWEVVPKHFRTFLTPDKFCSGHKNGTAACPGDSGGGLVFGDPVTNSRYLRGIVSVGVAPQGDDKCEVMEYSAFSSISANYQWLKQHLNESQSQNLKESESQIVFPNN